MSGRWISRGIAWVVVGILLTANLVVGARLSSQDTERGERETAYEKMALFTKVIEQIREHYVDGEKTDYEELIYGALQGMLQSLDTHSQFLDPEMYSDMKDDTSGHFGGLGIVISIKDGVLTIVAPMEDTPGYEAGLQAGDKIIEIDGESTEGVSLPEAVKQLRGPPNTDITIKIMRPKTLDIEEVTITRAIISVSSVKDAKILDEGIGYLRITQFNEPTGRALEDALDILLNEGMTGLILDLRNNPGGLLSSAVEVSQKFLPRRKMIVYTQGRDERQRTTYKAKGRKRYTEFPMAILVNEGSASASEIVSGALQDQRRAILIGEKTFGKGSVQSVLPLDDGSAIRLTTAKYYTPSKKMIHERGIEPDIVVPIDPEEWRKIQIRRSRPEHAQDEENQEELEKAVDTQLERALDLLKGILIFEAKSSPSLQHFAHSS